MNKQIAKQRLKSSGISAGYCALIVSFAVIFTWSAHTQFIEIYGTEFKIMDLTFDFFSRLFVNPVTAFTAIGGFMVAVAKAYSMIKSVRKSDGQKDD